MDYGDVIHDQPLNESLSNRIESAQYKAALPVTGAIQGSFREKLYQEFVLHHTAQKMKFYIESFFSKCDQIRRKLRIWSHLLKKSLM